MDTDGSLKIDWDEWREYHLLNPSGHSMHDIIQFWRHSSVRFLSLLQTGLKLRYCVSPPCKFPFLDPLLTNFPLPQKNLPCFSAPPHPLSALNPNPPPPPPPPPTDQRAGADLVILFQYIDIGEDFTVPDEFTVEEKVTGMWWRQLVAGAWAGVGKHNIHLS